MINRPENLAVGAGADRLVLVICKEGSGHTMPTDTHQKGSKRSQGGVHQLKNDCGVKIINNKCCILNG